ncbi:aldose 1-epimerase-like [Hibiscus syriacus]|uniref:Aldose 1-epimerase n=1 Tax=Hibiscus syriacus TaxID=106335 RepID=A0A6A3CCG2_HIBSY|nr:galactose mutarotase-like [Hibiscus syriacus]KAE8724849.1 aldose 1-epimerase-like [Hibiscus syriacus]
MDKVCFLLSLLLVVASGVVNGVRSEDKKDSKVEVFELKAGNISAKFANYGASLMSLVIPDKNGKPGDIVLGYDSPDAYKDDETYFGRVVGRVANRIRDGRFSLNRKEYQLKPNVNGKHMLHGGPGALADVIWEVKKIKEDANVPTILFTYDSPDGENGFPGKVKFSVRYLIRSDLRFRVTMKAKPIKEATPLNLVQHTYWNLGNHDIGDILSEEIQIFASEITPVDNEQIPTGKLQPVKGTPYDFIEPRVIGSRIKELPGGYDINYVIEGPDDPVKMKKIATVKDPRSGRVMRLTSNQPGLQFYTGNLIKDVKGKGGAVYKAHAGLCLTTQGFPDAVHHPNFPSIIVSPGKPYKHKMLYKFSMASDEEKKPEGKKLENRKLILNDKILI